QVAGGARVAKLTSAGALTVTSCTGCSGGTRLDQIAAATGPQTINSAANAQEWDWQSLATTNALTLGSKSLSSGAILFLSSNGAAGLTSQNGLNIALAGTNGTGGQTTYGAYIANTHGGSGNNVGLYASASGGT